MHIAKFSDRKKNDFTRDSLSQVLMFNDFPQELVQGINNGTACQGSGYVFQLCILWFPLTNDLNLNKLVFSGASKRASRRKKFRWNPESGLIISYDLSPFMWYQLWLNFYCEYVLSLAQNKLNLPK